MRTMVAKPPAAAERNEAKRQSALSVLDRKLKAALGQPEFFGRINVTISIQQGRIELIESTVSETMKT